MTIYTCPDCQGKGHLHLAFRTVMRLDTEGGCVDGYNPLVLYGTISYSKGLYACSGCGGCGLRFQPDMYRHENDDQAEEPA